MTNYLCEDRVLEKIRLISLRHNPIALRSGLTIIITLIRVLCEKGNENDALLKKVKALTIKIFTYVKNVLELLSNNELLIHQHGGKIPVVGLALIKIVEFFSSLIKLRDIEILNNIAEFNFPTILLQLFDKFYMCSNLHFKIYSFFEEAIKSNISSSLLKCLINQTKISEYIIQVMKNAYTSYQNSQKKFYRPNIVFIIKMSNMLIKESETNKVIQDYLSNDDWNTYVKNELYLINQRESKVNEKVEEKASDFQKTNDLKNSQPPSKNEETKNEVNVSPIFNSNYIVLPQPSEEVEEKITDELEDETKSPEEPESIAKMEVPNKIEKVGQEMDENEVLKLPEEKNIDDKTESINQNEEINPEKLVNNNDQETKQEDL